GRGQASTGQASPRRHRMIRVVKNRNVSGNDGVVADSYLLGHADDAAIVEANPVADNQLRIVSDIPCAGTADMDVVPDLDLSIPDHERRSSFQMQSTPDSRATVPEERLAIEECCDEVPCNTTDLRDDVDHAKHRSYDRQPDLAKGAPDRSSVPEHSAA